MKYEWKKSEKNIYLPKTKPELIIIPDFKFFIIEGAGNPNDSYFAEYIGFLYSLSYAVKMSIKKEKVTDYAVYPLEGIWDISEKAKESFDGKINKNDLMFKLMIRQPDFITEKFAMQIIEVIKKKKPHELLNRIKFEIIEDGECIQMLHIGSYDSEPESFRLMDDYAEQIKKIRKSHQHREIYLSDARKTAQDKLKTVLRYQIY